MDWKRIGKKLLFPPIWMMVILVIASAVALTLIFVKGLEESIPAYIVYVLAFYTLSVVTVFCAMVLPKKYSTIKQKIYDNPLGQPIYDGQSISYKHISVYILYSQHALCRYQPLVMAYAGKLLVYGACGLLCDHGGDAVSSGAVCSYTEDR